MSMSGSAHDPGDLLGRGDLLPRMVCAPPGPRSRALAEVLERVEAPGVNTIYAGQPGIAWHGARGANVIDLDGNVYIDLTGGFGVAAVGHGHPRVVAAAAAQTGVLVHGLGDVHPHALRAALAERLCGLVPVDEPRVYFAVSGADAVEIALKTAILATGKSVVVALERAYHGTTLGALAATWRPAFREPFAAHLHQRVRRLRPGCSDAELAQALAPGDVACVILEPIIGREGGVVPPPGWLGRVAAACRDAGALLIADEILTGLGRTGALFACQDEGVRPDILCCGKALGGGFPVAAAVGTRAVMDAWRTEGEALHTATFIAHPVACAAALAALDVLAELDLPARARALGARLAARLQALAASRPGVREIRGRGLMWAIEASSAALAGRWAAEATARGLLVLASGPVLRLDPPLVITEAQLDAAADLLDQALAAAHA